MSPLAAFEKDRAESSAKSVQKLNVAGQIPVRRWVHLPRQYIINTKSIATAVQSLNSGTNLSSADMHVSVFTLGSTLMLFTEFSRFSPIHFAFFLGLLVFAVIFWLGGGDST